MRSHLVKLAALIGVGLLVLTGCAGGAGPNVAAVVNGQVLTQAKVTEVATALANADLASWKAQQETSQPAAKRTPQQQAAYEKQLAEQTQKLSPAAYAPAVVGVTVKAAIAHQVAKTLNISLTDGQRNLLIKNNGLDSYAANPQTKDFIKDFVDVAIVFNDQRAQEASVAAAKSGSIEVNPLYGTWDPSQLTISGSGSLSVSTAATTGE